MKKRYLIAIAFVLLLAGCSDSSKKDQTYYCPMHPEVVDTKPGVCPICKMDLVLKDSGEKMESGGLVHEVELDSIKMLTADVEVYSIRELPFEKEIAAYSKFELPEQNKKVISARFGGRIEKLYLNKTGDFISTGMKLYDIYSPEIFQAQNELLVAVKSMIADNGLLEAAKNKLYLFGLSESQIDEIIKSGKAKSTISVYANTQGIILEKNISEGEYISTGKSLYTLADFSTLWNTAEVNANDVKYIKKGMRVKIVPDTGENDTLTGTVDFIYPIMNEQNRTVKVRIVFANKSNKLKANLTSVSIFPIKTKTAVLVPSDAVIITGKRNLVYVKTGGNKFIRREIVIGDKSNDFYEVISGLKPGEIVASSGGFLIDSEAELNKSLNK